MDIPKDFNNETMLLENGLTRTSHSLLLLI